MSTLEDEIRKGVDLREAGVPLELVRGEGFNTITVVPLDPPPGSIAARQEELFQSRGDTMLRYSPPGTFRGQYTAGELPGAIGRSAGGLATGVLGTITSLPMDLAGLVKGAYDAAVANDGERLDAFLSGLQQISETQIGPLMGSAAFEREMFNLIDTLPNTSKEKMELKDAVKAGLVLGYIGPTKTAAGAVPVVARKIQKATPEMPDGRPEAEPGKPEIEAADPEAPAPTTTTYRGRPRPQNRRAFVRVYRGTPLTLKEDQTFTGRVFTSSAQEVAETYRRGGEVYELDIDTTDFATVDFKGNLFNRGPNFSSTFVTLPSGERMNLSRLAQEKGIDWRTDYGEAPTTDQVVEFIQRALPEAKGVNITNVIDRGPSVGGSDDMPYSSLVAANKPQNVHVAFDDTTLYAPGPPVADIDELGLFSNLEQQIANQKADKFKPEQLRGTLVNSGVKEDELLWTGFDEFLEGKESVTKEEALSYIRGNKVIVTEKTLEPLDDPYGELQFSDSEIFEDDEIFLEEVAREKREEARDPDSYEHEYVLMAFPQRYTGVTDDELAKVMTGEVDDLRIEEDIIDTLMDMDRDYYREYIYEVVDTDNMPNYEIRGNDERGYRVFDPDGDLVTDDIRNLFEAQVEAQQHAVDYGFLEREGAQWENFRQDGGENYREILLKSDQYKRVSGPEESKNINERDRKLLEDLKENRNPDASQTAPLSAKTPSLSELEVDVLFEAIDLRKYLINRQEAVDRVGDQRPPEAFTGSHFGPAEENIVSHVRATDRKSEAPRPNLKEGETDYGSDIFYIDELQSDWGQRGRKHGFGITYDKELADELKAKIVKNETNSVQGEFVLELTFPQAEKRRLSYGRRSTPASTASGLQMGGSREFLESYIDNVLAMTNSPIPTGPFVGATEKWTELSLKRIIRKAADEGYHYVAWAPGDIHVERWNEPGLKTFYDNVLPKVSNKVLSKLDKKAKVQVIPVDIDGELQDTLAIPITDEIKQKTTKIGQPMFAVPAATVGGGALTQMGEENNDGAAR